VARDINKVLIRSAAPAARYAADRSRPEVTMNSSFLGLGVGLVDGHVLVYFLIVVNFSRGSIPSSSSPPCRRAGGHLLILLLTRTTLNVPSLTRP